MRTIMAAGIIVTALIVTNTRADDKPAHTGLEKMKKLAGTWVEADKDGNPTDKVVSVIKVTAGGSGYRDDNAGRPDGDGVGLPHG